MSDIEIVEVLEPAHEVIEVIDRDSDMAVVEVLQGLPGVQNVYVGYAPPEHPQEGWVWIDLNG